METKVIKGFVFSFGLNLRRTKIAGLPNECNIANYDVIFWTHEQPSNGNIAMDGLRGLVKCVNVGLLLCPRSKIRNNGFCI